MIDISSKPNIYTLCLASESECPLAATCLRSLVYRQEQQSLSENRKLTVVNPLADGLGYATEQCAAYNSNVKSRFAKGMSRMFNNVPHSEYSAVLDAVKGCFTNRTFFFQSKNGQRLIPVEVQEKIREVFLQHSLDEPLYDGYVEQFVWKDY